VSPYRFADHTADLMIEIEADDRKGLFVEGASALFDILVESSLVKVEQFREVRASGDDIRELFVDWLRELLYIFAVERIVFSQFEIEELSDTRLKARCGGQPFEKGRHEMRFDIKAVTYYGLEITQSEGKYRTSVVFDT
jgi:SHS2 domain-containing protein